EPAGGGGSAFASVDAPGLPWRPTRSAWCYGYPGVAAALLAAARAAGEPGWERAATELALRAARRPPDECGVVDAGLCHGAAGLAQIYNRLWQATGDERLRRAATDWAHRALDFPVPDDPGLLVGAAGVALALLATVSDVEPEWDRVLLLSPLAPS
ncbi:MAG TPA: lanthionine synthetase LanC family protein, partial [Gemmatimonadaceae bacterium]|nr:lanthionine synthetase LanC family protein [Gemmatimonadaceae bacterium]